MKSRHHVAVQMEEEQQWQKDNGPIVKTADQLWKYSGETEIDSVDLLVAQMKETVRLVLLDKGIYTLLSETRSKVLNYWLDNQDKNMEEIAKTLGVTSTTVTNTLRLYLLEIKRINKTN
jgi:DNA-directed RNA polymerase specialized sigma24 family protein